MQDDDPTERRQTDVMDADRARALQMTLGLDATIRNGDPLPPFFHQIYFWDARRESDLGRDGHPKTGGLIPDLGLPRRMWAGGDLRFHAPLRAGVGAEKRSSVERVAHKDGRSGPLGFVTLRHEIWQAGTLCVTELQDLVYREELAPGATTPRPVTARRDDLICETRRFTTTTLFRYSALTFNGHRIHYDASYAKTVEGYAGLVTHGPLLAQHLMLMAEATAPLTAFRFRATAPLLVSDTGAFCQNGADFWVRGPDGRQCMSATATWSD